MSPTCLDQAASEVLLREEADVLRQQVVIYIRGVLPCIVMYVCSALQPFFHTLDHLRIALLLFSSISFSCVIVKFLVLKSDSCQLKHRLESAEIFCLVARLFMHLVCIRFDSGPSDTFLKLLSLWILPVSAAKESQSPESFMIYLGCHNILVVLRFWGHWEEGGAWMIGTLIMDRMLLDLSQSRHDLMSMREDLSSANAKIEKLAEFTTKTLFARFCDACGTLSEDLAFAEPSPSLAAMLGLKESSIGGRDFCSMIDAEDVEGFRTHIASADLGAESCVHPDSIQVRLLDAFAKPVLVHIFHASFTGVDKKRLHFIGVSESWRPPRSKKKDGGKRMGLGTGVNSGSSGCLVAEALPQMLQPLLPTPGMRPMVARSEPARSLSPPVKTLGLETGRDKSSSMCRVRSPRPARLGSVGAGASEAAHSAGAQRARSPLPASPSAPALAPGTAGGATASEGLRSRQPLRQQEDPGHEAHG